MYLDLSSMPNKILVTGGSGFIGSNFLNKMVPKYRKTKFLNIDKLTYAGKSSNLLKFCHLQPRRIQEQ